MHKNLLFFFLIFYGTKNHAQFQFSGKTSHEYKNATAYLSIVKEYTKTTQFIAENVIASSKINKQGEFFFTGDFLQKQDVIYKIYIDNCNENISNAKHLLNHCLDHTSVHFIANNTDSIYFPLNDLKQMLCDFSYKRKANTYIKQIDSLQENLLLNLENTISNRQRKRIYKNYFTQLKAFSNQLKHPLAALYAFNLYANENSFSRNFYLDDLKKSDYYTTLESKLAENKSHEYATQLKKDLLLDSSSFKTHTFSSTHFILVALLVLSLFFNFFLFQKNKKKALVKPISYKEVLTKQEQRVFEAMHSDLSNKEIADTLFVSLSTVKTHINSIYSKLKITSRKDISIFFE